MSDNRPGLSEIRTRIATHPVFLAAMRARLGLPNFAEAGFDNSANGDPGAALCDAWAAIADVLTFYQERIANEAYLRTAVERRSIAEIARLVGYRLRPGVAASAPIAFTLDGDATATLRAGLRLQTVPVDDAPARRFELVETIEARAVWNQMAPRAFRAPVPDPALGRFYAAGVTLPLRPGDAVILISGGVPALRRVVETRADFDQQRSLVTLLATAPQPAVRTPESATPTTDEPPSLASLADTIRSRLGRATRAIPGTVRLTQNLGELLGVENDLSMRLRNMSVRDADSDNMFAALGALRGHHAVRLQAHVTRLRTAPFGSTAPMPMENGRVSQQDWALSEAANVLHIEAVAPDILPGSWVGFEAPPGQAVPPPLQVISATVVARVAYGMAVRCTRLELAGAWIDPTTATFAQLRALTVHAGSAPLPLAKDDIAEPLGDTNEIELDRVVGGLPAGRLLIVEGELFDQPGARMSETVLLTASRHVLSAHAEGHARTVLQLADRLTYSYRRASVVIWGNVARATEGESVSETLGSGNAARTGQAFGLSRPPLTYLSAATEHGVASTLQVIVNGLAWQEVDTLAQSGPTDRVFVIEPPGVAPMAVRFGNGVNGARLPSGDENVIARYRSGLGAGGNCDAGAISQLLTRPAGVRAAINPRPASGGADPETTDEARRNAPVGITALDRLVGVRDFGDFARSFAGIGKADATLLRRVDGPCVLVSIAGHDERPIPPDAALIQSLTDALEAWGDPSQSAIVMPARNLRVVLSARIGLRSGYVWDWVEPRLRTALLDRFGFARRTLGQTLWQSELLTAMYEVEGVDDVDLDMLAALADPVTTQMLQAVARSRAVGDLHVRPGRLATTQNGRQPRAAEIAFLSDALPELIALSEIAS